MSVELERRNFLRGRFKPETPALRPPFARAEADFSRLCERCSDCVKACEDGLIVNGENGLPELSFAKGECTFCGECAAACKTGALDAAHARPWTVRAQIGSSCLSLNAVFCRTCGDNCEEEALTFRLMTGGRSQPLIDRALCTGCGGCAFVCPNGSITMSEFETVTQREDCNA